jgi:hypothetical protein
METVFLFRHEYWNEFIWVEINYWYEMFFILTTFRFWVAISLPITAVVSYSFSNYEYWPIIEEIDYALAIPHWYLRPLMASLVVIPHHYLGFFYIIIVFLLILLLPWNYDNSGITMMGKTSDFIATILPADLNINSHYLFFTLLFGMMYLTTVLPTGRYFISIGSSEMFVFVFWFLILYFSMFSKYGFYTGQLAIKY